MAPSPITEDYYKVLKVEQTATTEQITKAYKQLALKLHPDDATEAFQLLGQAYETLKDESKRLAYDLTYPSNKPSRPYPQSYQTPRPPPASVPQSEVLREAAQIAALQKSKQERWARWQTKGNAFKSSILEIQTNIQRLEQDIKGLISILAAEAAIEAQKNSWGTWLLSPIYKKVEDGEEEKARKDRKRQERRIEKDIKERRLDLKKADLKELETLIGKAIKEVDAADLCDDRNIRAAGARILAGQTREREEREKVERDRLARIWRQQQEQWEEREREATEVRRKHHAEMRAAEQKREEEDIRSRFPENSTRQAYTSGCRHDGWWPKVQGRTVCPECNESWTYLLECPNCKMKACPKCLGAMRPRTIPRYRTKTRHPSPDYDHDF